MNRFVWILLLLTVSYFAYAQQQDSSKSILLPTPLPDSIRLDSFTINPQSIKLLLPDGNIADTSYYKLNINNGFLLFNKQKFSTTNALKVYWDAMSVNLSKEYKHKDTTLLVPQLKNFYDPFSLNYNLKKGTWLETDGLDKSGSISRGFSVGNRQDFSLNSSLNLVLSGKLNNDLEIQAVISDNNIPIQPEGNTQQIQEFDKIFIRLKKDKTEFMAGDIDINSSKQDYFLKYNRKSQGGDIQASFSPNIFKNDEIEVKANVSFAKGRYTRQEIKPIDGNLGPYRLKGNNNETFIVILAGTEKIFIDGNEITRGEDHDYTIDYNTAEITFTTKTTITSKSRIVAEYEYSDKTYSRSLITSEVAYKAGNFAGSFSIFSESDLKNQTIQQDLTERQKKVMSLIGDSLQNAFTSGVDSIGFNNKRVMYAMIDSLGYDSVFIYSTNSDSAKYALTFSYVGANKGNYVQMGSSANGRVFKWVAPKGGTLQGDYEPIVLLTTPHKAEIYSFKAKYNLAQNTYINAEYAISNKDINLFSTINDNNNIGQAFFIQINNIKHLGADSNKMWKMQTIARTEIVNKNFNEIEPFRDVEFMRNWSIEKKAMPSNTYFGIAKISATNKKNDKIQISSGLFSQGEKENAYQNTFQLKKTINTSSVTTNLLLTNLPLKTTNTNFFQYQNRFEQKIRRFNIGAEANGEIREVKEKNNNFINPQSFSWWLAKGYSGYSDSSFKTTIYYQFRKDKIVDSIRFIPLSFMTDIGLESNAKINDWNNLTFRATLRSVKYTNTSTPNEEVLLGRTEYNGRIKKRFLIFGASYEAGSGMEAKKEFSYIEVAPGQGVFAWNDYNKNNIRELNEFEPAMFSDQANFIRIYTPTNDYVRVFSIQFNGNFMINPSEVLKKDNFFHEFFSRITNRSAFSWNKKTSSSILKEMYLPFSKTKDDSTLVAQDATLRNILAFKTTDSRFSIAWTSNSNKSRGLFTNGIEDRSLKQNEIKINKTFFSSFITELSAQQVMRSFDSQFFKTNNYKIKEESIKPSISWQYSTTFRTTFLFQYSEKNNILSIEKSIVRKIGTELKISQSSKGMATLQFNMLQISYNGETNTSVGYLMLEGLQVGKNFTWGVNIQYSISSNIQINFVYDGRSNKNTPTIHTGNVQVRVFF